MGRVLARSRFMSAVLSPYPTITMPSYNISCAAVLDRRRRNNAGGGITLSPRERRRRMR
jgi:hypothetical protein